VSQREAARAKVRRSAWAASTSSAGGFNPACSSCSLRVSAASLAASRGQPDARQWKGTRYVPTATTQRDVRRQLAIPPSPASVSPWGGGFPRDLLCPESARRCSCPLPFLSSAPSLSFAALPACLLVSRPPAGTTTAVPTRGVRCGKNLPWTLAPRGELDGQWWHLPRDSLGII
jgi:hypothetical protein